MKQKIVIVDYTYFIHQSIFSYNSAKKRQQENPELFVSPSTYICMSSLISALKKVGINEEMGDKVILAADRKNSWRKEVEKEYKAHRQEQRDKAEFVDWTEEYEKHNRLLERINDNLPFFVLKLENCEADDIISEACRFFADKKIVIISPDSDMWQLLSYDNVRIFSPHPHKSTRSCPYKILDLDREKEKEKAFKNLMSKVRKEKTDNLVSEILTSEDYDKRLQCVSLLELPDYISQRIRPELDKVANTEKEFFIPEVFSPGIQKKLVGLFSQDNIIDYEYCRQLYSKRLKRKLKNKGVK